MTTPAEKLYDALTQAKQEAQMANGPFGRMQVVQIIDSFLGEYAKGLAKERKKGALHPEAKAVFNAYPRRQGGEAALASISKAIREDGLETVLAGTTEYASAVARWSYARKVSPSGSSLIPLPTTWFGNRCYTDDPKHWWEGTGKKGAADVEKEKEEKQALLLREPEGWRFAHPETRFVKENTPWGSIDTASQKWIIANTPQKAHTG